MEFSERCEELPPMLYELEGNMFPLRYTLPTSTAYVRYPRSGGLDFHTPERLPRGRAEKAKIHGGGLGGDRVNYEVTSSENWRIENTRYAEVLRRYHASEAARKEVPAEVPAEKELPAEPPSPEHEWTKEYGWTLPSPPDPQYVSGFPRRVTYLVSAASDWVPGIVYEPIRVWPTGRTGRLPAYFTTVNERYQEQLRRYNEISA